MNNTDFKKQAEELGIEYIPPHIFTPPPERIGDIGKSGKSGYLKELMKPVAMCGGCGKKFTIVDRKDACGSQICPFGTLTN